MSGWLRVAWLIVRESFASPRTTSVIRRDRVDRHVHGAWCHPSADGCPDRPGM